MSRFTASPNPDLRPARLALAHAALLVLFLTWRFGGMEAVARDVATWALLPAPVITLYAWLRRGSDGRRAFLWIAIPSLLLCAQVWVSLQNPSMRPITLWGVSSLSAIPHKEFLPSTPFPAATRADFLLNAGLVLVAQNVLLARPPRAWLRGFLALIVTNATALAIVGTLFKLGGATAILGTTASPNPHFFATFIYHNHWGAFALLSSGAAAGLAFYHATRGSSGRSAWHTPAPLCALASLVLLLTLPLSSGRASTAAGFLFSALCLAFAVHRVWCTSAPSARHRPLLIVLALIVIGGACGIWLADRTLSSEADQTALQLRELREGGIGDARFVIARDTWRLIREKPIFGWGWQSFQYAYPRVSSPIPRMHERQPFMAVVDAHNDWLQLLAELGIVGTALALAVIAGWMRWAPTSAWLRSPSRELLLAFGALALLAVVDFPLANPAVVLTAALLLSIGAELARGHAPTAPASS